MGEGGVLSNHSALPSDVISGGEEERFAWELLLPRDTMKETSAQAASDGEAV